MFWSKTSWYTHNSSRYQFQIDRKSFLKKIKWKKSSDSKNEEEEQKWKSKDFLNKSSEDRNKSNREEKRLNVELRRLSRSTCESSSNKNKELSSREGPRNSYWLEEALTWRSTEQKINHRRDLQIYFKKQENLSCLI